MLLTDLAFFNQLRSVFEHCRPIIYLSQCLCCHKDLAPITVSTDTFMHLYEHVIGDFLSYALKDGCRKASFIKGPPMNGEPSRPRPKLGGPPLDRLAIFRPPSNPRWSPSSSALTLSGTLLHRQTFTEGSRRCSTGTNLSRSSRDAILLLAFPGHMLVNSLPLGHA